MKVGALHYLHEMTEIIFEHGGALDKFMGDGIMVFFNDPVDQDEHTARAVRASLAMQARMEGLAAGGEIVISHATYDEVSEGVEVEDRDEAPVKGLHSPVKIYKVMGVK